MKRSFSLFLALRYLQPKRTFLSIITLISVVGVTLGITVLILVISVMTGFDRELRSKVIGFDAHLIIGSDSIIADWQDLEAKIQQVDGVVATAPFVQGPVIVEHQNRRLAPKIRGIDPESEIKVSDVSKFVLEGGEFNLDGDYAILGSGLARSLRAQVGDTVTVFSPGNLNGILDELDRLEVDPSGEKPEDIVNLREMILPTELVVTGIFESGRYDYDSEFLLVPLYVGQELYSLEDNVHGITVKTIDPYLAERIKGTLYDVVEYPNYISTWIDLNKQLFDAIRMERNVMFFLLMFIVVVAAFGIMSTLITVTVQKTREIGIMKALGAGTWQVVWVFLAQGMVVGLFGTATGLGMGILLVQFRNEVSRWMARTLHVEVFPVEVYQFSEIPAQIVYEDVAIICVSAFIICSVAALIPAYFAARMDPVRALRRE